MEHQDWNTIYVKANKQLKEKEKQKEGGKQITSQKKIKWKKIEEGNLKHNKTPSELGKIIQSKRLSQNMTQKDLAQKLNILLK